MKFSRKTRKASGWPAAVVIERLNPRLILDAPLALASDGLLLADPTPEELLEPAVFVESEAAGGGTAATALPPADSAPAGDATASEPRGELTMTTTSCGGVGTLRVYSLGNVAEGPALGPATSYFRFEGTSCGSPPASTMTVNFGVSGTATEGTGPGADYSGSGLTAGSVTISMYNGYGYTDVGFSAIDDDRVEPTETIQVDVDTATTEPAGTVFIMNAVAKATVASGDYDITYYY